MTYSARSADASATPRLDSQLCFALYTATHRMTRTYRSLLEPLGLTYVQYLVMLVLWEDTPRSVGALGEALFLDSGTLTPLLKRMEKNGLISRRRDVDDERRVLIELTDEGEKLRSKALRVSEDVRCRIDMNRDEIESLRQDVMDLVERIDAQEKATARDG